MAADKSVRVEVRGVRELQKAFKQVDSTLQAELRLAFKGIAEKVATIARGRVESDSGRAASSITARANNRGASIAFGGSKAPYYPWLDFGGSTGRGHRPGQAWSGAIKRDWKGQPVGSGRYVYPAITDQREETAEAVDAAIERIAERAGFETRGGE